MNLFRAVVPSLILLGGPAIASADALPPPTTQPTEQIRSIKPSFTPFDPNRYMRVSEVKPGMKGYGLSVFSGTKIDKFDVEVVSILKNFNPKYDVVLINCHGQNLEHTGAVAGMSGSPIFLTDDQGRTRMIGAFAYGWPLDKDPLAGVQPIEYMLNLPVGGSPDSMVKTEAGDAHGAAGDVSTGSKAQHQSAGDGIVAPAGKPVWSLDDCLKKIPAAGKPARELMARWPAVVDQTSIASDEAPRLEPLATPLMTTGISPGVLEEFAPMFKECGLVAMQAGSLDTPAPGPGTGTVKTDEPPAKMEPGSVLAVPLLTGDEEMTAIGTVTEVAGDKVYGFGHPFNGEGPIALPMAAGDIATVVANLQTSFKLGSMSQACGTLTTDQTVGVAGAIGPSAPMAPVELHLKYTDGSVDQTYHFRAAIHPRFTPLIAAAALGAALTGPKELPQYHTLDYDLTLEFNNGKTVHIVNTNANGGPMDLFNEIGVPLMAASENPFERVMLKKMTGTMTVSPELREARILSVLVPKLKYQPGETVKAFVTYRPFRAAEQILPIELDLPKNLPDGNYQLTISDWQKYFEDERQVHPFKFTAQSIDEVFDVIDDAVSVRHGALYLRLLRQPDGVAVGRTAMPKLPGSMREVLLGGGRSDVTQFVSSIVKTVPTQQVMSGSAEFMLTIDRNGKVETPTRPVKVESPPAVPKADMGKPDATKRGPSTQP